MCICWAVFSCPVVSDSYVYLSVMKIIKIEGHMNALMRRVSDVAILRKWVIWVEREGGNVQVSWEKVEPSVLQRNRVFIHKKMCKLWTEINSVIIIATISVTVNLVLFSHLDLILVLSHGNREHFSFSF